MIVNLASCSWSFRALLHASCRVMSSDPESNSMWVGTDKGVVFQLQLTARKVDSRLVYHLEQLQSLQLAQVTGQMPGLVISAAASAGAVCPFPQSQHQQLPTPFSQAPRQLTLSSSASSYRGSNGIVDAVHNPLYQPTQPLPSTDTTPEGRAAALPSFSGQVNGQLVSSQPLLSKQQMGLGTYVSASSTPHQPFEQRLPAEVVQGPHQQRPGSPPSLSIPLSHAKPPSGSPSAAELLSPQPGALQMLRQGSLQRQGSVQRPGSIQRQSSVHSTGSGRSGRSTAARAVPGPALSSTDAAPAHAVAVVWNRVITSSGMHPQCILREWSLEGALLMTHPYCSLGGLCC